MQPAEVFRLVALEINRHRLPVLADEEQAGVFNDTQYRPLLRFVVDWQRHFDAVVTCGFDPRGELLEGLFVSPGRAQIVDFHDRLEVICSYPDVAGVGDSCVFERGHFTEYRDSSSQNRVEDGRTRSLAKPQAEFQNG